MAVIIVTAERSTDDGLDLAEAIALAQSGDTITFADGVSDIHLDAEIIIGESVLIDGDADNDGIPDVTITGAGDHRLFRVSQSYDPATQTRSPVEVEMEGLVLQNGASDDGAAIFVQPKNSLIVRDSILRDNHADSDGGAIYGQLSSVAVYGSTLYGNSAVVGSAVAVLGGTLIDPVDGEILIQPTLLLQDSTVAQNEYSGTTFIGISAIYAYQANSKFASSTITGNEGGVVYSANEIDDVTRLIMNDSILSGNVDPSDGLPRNFQYFRVDSGPSTPFEFNPKGSVIGTDIATGSLATGNTSTNDPELSSLGFVDGLGPYLAPIEDGVSAPSASAIVGAYKGTGGQTFQGLDDVNPESFDGGDGTDVMSYANAESGVIVSLNETGEQQTGGGGPDTLANFEGLEGSEYDDQLTGNDDANILSGLGGDDLFVLMGASDIVIGGEGRDTVITPQAFADITLSTVISGDGELIVITTSADFVSKTLFGVETIQFADQTLSKAFSDDTFSVWHSNVQGYLIVPTAGAYIQLKAPGGGPTFEQNIGGFQPVGIFESDLGLLVLFESADGNTNSVWQLDANGNYLTGTVLAEPALVEDAFQTDLDGDSDIGIASDLISQAGDVDLWQRQADGRLLVDDGSGWLKQITYRGVDVTYDWAPGWTPLLVEDRSEGGYQLLWDHDSLNQILVWHLDSLGRYVENSLELLTPGIELTALEEELGALLDGDGQIGFGPKPAIDTRGDAFMYQDETYGAYFINAPGGEQFLIHYLGEPFTDDTLPGWTITSGEFSDTGFTILLEEASSGTLVTWELDPQAHYIQGSFKVVEDIQLLEGYFNEDIDGDGDTGPERTIIEDWREVYLYTRDADGAYMVELPNDEFVVLSYNETPLTASFLPGLQIVHAELSESGVQALWEDEANELYYLWQFDQNGDFTGEYELLDHVGVVEYLFGADIDGDLEWGPPGTLLEDDGEVRTLLGDDGIYKVVIDDGGRVHDVKLSGTPVTPDSFAGYELIHAEQKDGGYQVLFSFENGRSYTVWDLSQTGDYVAGSGRTETDIQLLEEMFDTNLNEGADLN